MLHHPSICIDYVQSDQTVPISLVCYQGKGWVYSSHLPILNPDPVRLSCELSELKLDEPHEGCS